MKYYAIADLHGRYDLLEKCLNKLGTIDDANNADSKIILLGDYIDRGPDSAKIIQRLMGMQSVDKNVICLKGNHEDIVLQTYDTPLWKDWWFSNGGDTTYASYGGDVDTEHLNWMRRLPLYYATPEHIFVHAGIPDNSLPLEEQNHERLMWMLYGKDDHGGWNDTHVVHGHHIHEDGPHEWAHRTALDTGSFYTDRQVIGVFDDTQGRALEFIEVKA